MANKKALWLMELGLCPVLLGSNGDGLKRPVFKGWQTAVYTAADVRRWPPHNNVGIRCGLQPDGRGLMVFDFDKDATHLFPAWYRLIKNEPALASCHPLVVVSSGRGYHVYFYTEHSPRSQTLAADCVLMDPGHNGRGSLRKFIELLGSGRQVVSVGSLHHNGKRYQFCGHVDYQHIPTVSLEQYQLLMAAAKSFDKRPLTRLHPVSRYTTFANNQLRDVHNCLEYARKYIGAAEHVEQNGDIRFMGCGGLLITPDGRGWYSFSDQTGGGLAKLVHWHRSWGGGQL